MFKYSSKYVCSVGNNKMSVLSLKPGTSRRSIRDSVVNTEHIIINVGSSQRLALKRKLLSAFLDVI